MLSMPKKCLKLILGLIGNFIFWAFMQTVGDDFWSSLFRLSLNEKYDFDGLRLLFCFLKTISLNNINVLHRVPSNLLY